MNIIEKMGLILFITVSPIETTIVYPLKIFDWFIVALSLMGIVGFLFGKEIENVSNGWKIVRRYEIYEVKDE